MNRSFLQRDRGRRFAFWFCLVAGTSGLGAGTLGWRLGPPSGDLVRVGGLSERAYGWNAPWRAPSGLKTRSVDLDALAAGADPGEILVIGDSFSDPEGSPTPWPSILAALTGRRVHVAALDRDLEPVARYLSSAAFREQPPERVILQMAERTVWRRVRTMPTNGCRPSTAPSPLPLHPVATAETTVERRSHFESFNEIIGWGALAARIRLLDRSKTRVFELERADLFSSRASKRLLVFWEDVDEHASGVYAPEGPSPAEQRVFCALRTLVAAAQGRMFVAIAPDKLTAYGTWLSDPAAGRKPVSFPKVAAEALKEANIDLSGPLTAAIESGRIDVYLPDDTHWGAAGHAIVSETVAATLSGRRE